MKQIIEKKPKIALCRRCGGRGVLRIVNRMGETIICPQCMGSGRVLVSCKMNLDIRPYVEPK